MIRVIARVTSRPESVQAVRKALEEVVSATRHEEGCISYELFQNDEAAVEFVTVEAWHDQAAVDLHLTMPHVAEAAARVAPLLALPLQVQRFTQIM